ncbi:MAG: hypothetical protein RIC16_03400 [Rhodospirillales bacterium]
MMSMLSRIRFLPVTIFAATLMLTIKVSDIWEGVEGLAESTLEISQASAQIADQQEPQSLTPSFEEQPAADGTVPVEETPGLIDPLDVDPFAFSSSNIAEEAERIASEDPTLMSEQEIVLLQQLSDRRAEIEKRERDIDQRMGLLAAAEARIDNKIRQLRAFQETIEELIVTYDDQQEQKTQSLVRIYENMKPKDAARIFEDLDMDTLLLVAERMKERKLADIMANMNANRARDITVELSRLRELPDIAGADG